MEYLPDRGLKQEELLRFSTCNYIQEHHNIILLGATGSGKTYLACALGMAAARRFYAVKYIRLPDLLVEFQIARGNGTIRKLMAQYKKYALLIIDEWLLYPLKETEARDLLEIVESRYKRNSTIFCSQFDIPGWPKSCLTHCWLMPSATESSTMLTPWSLEARNPCASGRVCRTSDSDYIYDTLTDLFCPYST